MGEKIVWHLYVLVDPRTSSVFYVGVTTMPRGRCSGHRNDVGSAAYEIVSEIHKAGLKCRMRIIARYDDKEVAMAHEKRLIDTLSGLVNRR